MKNSIRRADGVLLILLACSLSLNVYVLHSHAGAFRLGRTAKAGLERGDQVPPFVAQELDGRVREIRFDEIDRPTILYVFSPACSWCERNWANIKTIADRRPQSHRLIGVALTGSADEVSALLARYRVSFDDVLLPSSEARKVFRLSGTPDTIAIDTAGRVLAHWNGAFMGEKATEVEAFFGVVLPGLVEL